VKVESKCESNDLSCTANKVHGSTPQGAMMLYCILNLGVRKALQTGELENMTYRVKHMHTWNT
jgi:hypothetical protein